MRISVDTNALERQLVSLPVARILLTRGSRWADATVVAASVGAAELSKLLQRVGGSDALAPAGEVFRGETPGRRVFVGIRSPAGDSGWSERHLVAALLAAAGEVGSGRLVERLRNAAGEPTLFRRADALELGVVDRWTEAGPAVVPLSTLADPVSPAQSGTGEDAEPWVRALRALMREASHLGSVVAGPIALEVRFPGRIPHWVGLECSSPQPGGWGLDTARLSALLRMLLLVDEPGDSERT